MHSYIGSKVKRKKKWQICRHSLTAESAGGQGRCKIKWSRELCCFTQLSRGTLQGILKIKSSTISKSWPPLILHACIYSTDTINYQVNQHSRDRMRAKRDNGCMPAWKKIACSLDLECLPWLSLLVRTAANNMATFV